MPCPHCNDTGFRNVRFGPGGRYTGVQKCECRATTDAARPGGFQDVGSIGFGRRSQALRDAVDKGTKDWRNEKPMARQQPSDEQIEQAAGTLSYASSRAAMLGLPDREIAAIILNHRGKKNAVSIEDICKMLWPEEWNAGGVNDRASARVNLARTVKAAVERIRTEARIPVAAHKGNPGGYYIPETAEECDEMHDRHMREGIKHIRTAQLFKKDADLVEELRGQMKLGA